MLGLLGNMTVINVVLLFFTFPIMAQSSKTAVNNSDSIVSHNTTIGIVEPYVIHDIPVIKNIIIDALKDEFEYKYDYIIIENDSTLETKGDYQFVDFDKLISRSQQSDFLLITKHTTVQTDHISYSYPNERTYDSIIKMSLYDQDGRQRAQSEYDFIPSMHFRSSNKGMKSAEKASKAAAKSIVKEIDKLLGNAD